MQLKQPLNEARAEMSAKYRDELATAIETETTSYEHLARRFGVSTGFVYKLARDRGIRREADKAQVIESALDSTTAVGNPEDCEFGDIELFPYRTPVTQGEFECLKVSAYPANALWNYALDPEEGGGYWGYEVCDEKTCRWWRNAVATRYRQLEHEDEVSND